MKRERGKEKASPIQFRRRESEGRERGKIDERGRKDEERNRIFAIYKLEAGSKRKVRTFLR